MLLPLHIDRLIFSFQKLLKVHQATAVTAAASAEVAAPSAAATTVTVTAATNRLHL